MSDKVLNGWRVMAYTGHRIHPDDRWEVYGPNGGGVVNAGDVHDWAVRGLLDALAEKGGACVAQPAPAWEREAFEVEIPDISAIYDGRSFIPYRPLEAGERLMTVAQHLRIEKQLRAALTRPAQTEQQPVAWLIDWPEEPELGHYFSDEPNEHARSRPLYAAPIAQTPAELGDAYQGAAVIPAEKPLPELMMASYHEAIGWNACRQAMLAAAPAQPAAQEHEDSETLRRICEIFGIGEKASTRSAILANVENTHKFASMLHAIEGEFFMVPGEIDPDYPDDQPYDCLVNCWASSVDQYVDQFREALKTVASPAQSEKVAHSAQWPTTPGLSAAPAQPEAHGDVQRLREALRECLGVLELHRLTGQVYKNGDAALAASTGQEVGK